jgi:hypothetical protein
VEPWRAGDAPVKVSLVALSSNAPWVLMGVRGATFSVTARITCRACFAV